MSRTRQCARCDIKRCSRKLKMQLEKIIVNSGSNMLAMLITADERCHVGGCSGNVIPKDMMLLQK